MSFAVKDCALISRMGGVDSAQNLRELRERLLVCPVECLFHHFCETAIRPSFDDPEFRNDFAIWAARELQDRALAEQLGVVNPYAFESLESLRQTVIEIVDDHLSTLPWVPWVRRGHDFRFMRAVTVVFDTGVVLEQPRELIKALPEMSLSSIYYHYVEARRRTPEGNDDFSAWLAGFDNGTGPLLEALEEVDFYFMGLQEVKDTLIQITAPLAERGSHG